MTLPEGLLLVSFYLMIQRGLWANFNLGIYITIEGKYTCSGFSICAYCKLKNQLSWALS